jgi:Vam6/Vps39-like protein vacuolar protein sorting-associated protein 39
VDELVAQRLYDEAISLLNQVDEVLLKNKVSISLGNDLSKEMRLRTVRYLKAFSLFEQKKYDESMDLFSSVSATPRIVISLFPPQIAGDLSQPEHNDPEDPESQTTDQPETGDFSPIIASAIPEGLRASLDSPRKSKDGESDTSSILSKHTEISNSGPPGTPSPFPRNLICRGQGFDSRYVSADSISRRYEIQIISLAKYRSIC